MKKLTIREATSGYTKEFGFNKDWKKQGCVCGYEHCIELMSITEKTTKISCPIFGHNCPGGKEQVQKCIIGEKRFIPEGRFYKGEKP